mmetsp:Transcript_9868/g.13957  ORF Transcript_9868/g.13957 Transcript_9868/m.13957 type:complete len:501 (+) Transcript_9868:187-1689(+)
MMFNIAFRILALSLVVVSSQAQCPEVSSASADIPCTPDAIQKLLPGCGFTTQVIVQACKDASYDFGELSNLHYQFDKAYMDGGTIWNDGKAGEASATESRITKALETIGSNSVVNWPEYEALQEYVGPDQTPYMSNFNFTDGSCDLNTVMCCFIEDRDDGETIPDNSEVCTHDLRDSRRSNHINRGWAEFDNNANTYCTGFTFSSDGNDVTNRFKGNSLLDLSFRNTVENGYVKNIPGAPMCACIEQMPTVTNAACRSVQAGGESLTYSVINGQLVVESITAKVSYGACVDDLLDHAKSTHGIDLSDHLVKSCDEPKEAILNEKFWVPTQITNNYEYISEEWELVAGMGTTPWPIRTDDASLAEYDREFREKLGKPPFLVRRYCESCVESHRDIYYKRITELPAELNFFDLLMNNWFNTPGNAHHTDFELYSSVDDAVKGVGEWNYCNFNDAKVGFPRDCGPYRKTNGQWNSYVRRVSTGRFNAQHHGFYILKDPNTIVM